jgi:hypothetical protein
MDPIISSSINTGLSTGIILAGIALISIAFVIGMTIINKRVTNLKDYSYKFF